MAPPSHSCFFIINYLVRGMMYYRRALRLQAFLDKTSDQGAYGSLVLMKSSDEFLFLHEWKFITTRTIRLIKFW
jgi:hypothetical protein